MLLKGGDFIFVIVITSVFVENGIFLSDDYIHFVFVRNFMSLLNCFVSFALYKCGDTKTVPTRNSLVEIKLMIQSSSYVWENKHCT